MIPVSITAGVMMNLLKYTIIGAALMGLAGCGTIANQIGSKPLAQTIDEDAIRLNNAHVRATNGVITVNILRARDNWPKGYTTLSGVRFNPTRSVSGGFNFDQVFIPGGSNRTRPEVRSNLSGTLAADAQYSVNPFAEQDASQSLYSADGSEELFRRYLEAGWPRRVVFALFVDRVVKAGEPCFINGDGELAKAVNGVDGKDVDKFQAKYEDEGHPCRTVLNAFKSVDGISWRYLPDSNFNCQNEICTRINTPRRDNFRRGIGLKPAFLDAEPCATIESTDTKGLIAGKSEEGLGARIAAAEAAAGRDIITTDKGVRLCNRLSTGRTFYARYDVLKADKDGQFEKKSQSLKRLFASYQDRALASFLLRNKYESGKPALDKFKIIGDPDIDKCVAELLKIAKLMTNVELRECTSDGDHFYDLLNEFIKRNTFHQPVGSIHFRSFDDMVYFVGETLRLEAEKDDQGDLKSPSDYGLCVSWESIKDEKDDDIKVCSGRLFSVLNRNEILALGQKLVTGFGVEVNHAGRAWRALPERDNAKYPVNVLEEEIDNTGLVLSILSQLYLLNQSSDFLEAPENLLLQ